MAIEKKIPRGEKIMEEALGKDRNAVSTISIFLCYAREDEAFLEELEQHLAPLKRQELITSWHDRDIRAGSAWEQEIHAHLDNAQLIVLLVSPSFMSSDYCYSIEMTRALERQRRGESRVIPVIVRPVYWQGEPLGNLQALPTDGKPIASWFNRDEAFFDVAEGIRHVIEEIKAQLNHQQGEDGGKNFQNASVLKQESLPGEGPSKAYKNGKRHSGKNIDKRKNRNLGRRGFLVSVAILLILALSLVPFIPFPACFASFCRSSQQPVNPQSTQDPGKVSDANLSVMLLRVDSPSFVFFGDPSRYSDGGTPPTDIGAVLLAKNTTSYYTIILSLRNLKQAGNDMFIDYVTLELLQIPSIFRPLTVWTHSIATTDTTHPYPATYKGQNPGQLLYCGPSQNVSLAPEEPDQLDIQVHSTVSAYLQFKVKITYHITGAPQTLTLPRIFQVVFSDTSNWQEYILQYGSLVKKP
jgi:hypothetical protein